MKLPIPPRQFDEHNPEMVDLPNADPALLRDELRSIRIINRRHGGLTALHNALMPMVMTTDPARTLEILDLATGSGDQPIALVRLLRQRGRRAVITAIDKNERVIAVARELAASVPDIRFERGNILELTYPDGSFDFVVCSLALHHFSRKDAARILQQMDRLCRIGFVVNDLSRSYVAAAGAWLYTRLTTRNIMTRNDAVASVLASFTKSEFTSLAQEAGIGQLRTYTTPMFRIVAVKQRMVR